MKIERIEIWDFRPPFRDGPYAMSHVTSSHAYGRLLRIRDDGGHAGLGEVVFAPSVAEAEREQRIRDEGEIFSGLVGKPVSALLTCADTLRERDKSWRGIAFGLETAWFGLEGQRTRTPLSVLLGGGGHGTVADYFSISEPSLERIRHRMSLAGPDRRVLQLKLGVAGLQRDIDQLGAVLALMSERQIVMADANGGWSVDQACEIVARFDDDRVIWEEPCKTYEENVRVSDRTGRPVMFDQCIGDYAAACRAIADGIAHSICIKPAVLGGLRVGREVRDRAASAGMRMRIDGPWCGDIASAAIVALALGAPPDRLISSCDLREPLSIPVDLAGVRSVPPDGLGVPTGPGIGIAFPEDQMGPPEKSFG